MRAGLVCAGGVSRTFVARMPTLLATISVVKAGSLRVARRIANSLRAGDPADQYSALAGCDVVWVAVPESALDQVTRELGSLRAPVVICGTSRESSQFRIARPASLEAVLAEERLLVAEGHADALRYLRRVAVAENRKLIEMRPGSKPTFLAGLHLASHVALPWIASAVEALRSSGFSRTEATTIVEELGTRTLRSYAKAGAKAWRPSAARDLRRSIESKIPDPRLSRIYREAIDRALRFFEER